MKDAVFAVVLLVAAAAVTVGCWKLQESLGWIVGGVLLAGWAWLLVADDPTGAASIAAGDDEGDL